VSQGLLSRGQEGQASLNRYSCCNQNHKEVIGFLVRINLVFRRKLSKTELNMYKSEVTALLQLNHPNVIDLFAFLEVENYLYIVTEFMKGGTVR
jgi:serine/threonine protein kinase